MNKIFKIASIAMIALSANGAFAQTSQDAATTILNVNLEGTYEITVGQASVDIDMNEAIHFTNGNDSGSQANHVQVSATGDYQVNVSATGELMFGSNSIPVSTVTVTPTLGDYLGTGVGTPPAMTLTPSPLATVAADADGTTIISSTAGDLRGFHVVYAIPAAQTAQYLNKPEGTYTTTVTYTLYSL